MRGPLPIACRYSFTPGTAWAPSPTTWPASPARFRTFASSSATPLSSTWPRAVAVLAPYPNVYFETSVVQAFDLFAVLDAIDPARVLYGSDLPYGSSAHALHELAVMANIAGVHPAHYADLFGGNLLRLLDSEADR